MPASRARDSGPPGLHLRSCFYREAAPDWSVATHHHDVHQWYICVHGTLRVRIGATDHDLGPEQSVVVPPLAIRAVTCPARAPGYVVAIFASGPLDIGALIGPNLILPATLRYDLRALVEELRGPGEDSRLLVRALLTRLLIGHKRAVVQRAAAEHGSRARLPAAAVLSPLNHSRHHAVIQAADSYLRAHLAEPLRRAEVAAAVHLSEPQLGRIYRVQTGQTVGQRLCALRIAAAKPLLLESPRSIAQVAVAVGIMSFSHFARRFKQRVGVSPGDYRRSGGQAYMEAP